MGRRASKPNTWRGEAAVQELRGASVVLPTPSDSDTPKRRSTDAATVVSRRIKPPHHDARKWASLPPSAPSEAPPSSRHIAAEPSEQGHPPPAHMGPSCPDARGMDVSPCANVRVGPPRKRCRTAPGPHRCCQPRSEVAPRAVAQKLQLKARAETSRATGARPSLRTPPLDGTSARPAPRAPRPPTSEKCV